MSKPKVQFIDPREVSPRIGQTPNPLFDADAVTRADETLKAMSGSFEQWLEADVQKLQTARTAAEQVGWRDEGVSRLFIAAHDLKGMGATYGYPLVTQLCASLCRLIETEAGKRAAQANPALAAAHVDAVRAALRDRIATAAHPVGRALLQALEAQVASLGVAPE